MCQPRGRGDDHIVVLRASHAPLFLNSRWLRAASTWSDSRAASAAATALPSAERENTRRLSPSTGRTVDVNNPSCTNRSSARYSVPGLGLILPPERRSISIITSYPCRSSSASASRISNATGVRGRNDSADSLRGFVIALSLEFFQRHFRVRSCLHDDTSHGAFFVALKRQVAARGLEKEFRLAFREHLSLPQTRTLTPETAVLERNLHHHLGRIPVVANVRLENLFGNGDFFAFRLLRTLRREGESGSLDLGQARAVQCVWIRCFQKSSRELLDAARVREPGRAVAAVRNDHHSGPAEP